MTHPEDSTRLQAMLHNSNNNNPRPRDQPRSMRRPERSDAFETHPTFHSHPPARLLHEWARIQRPTTASSKAHNIPRPRHSNKVQCSTRRRCNKQTRCSGNNHNNRSPNTRRASCMACRSHRHHKRLSRPTSRNTDKDQIRLPRHWRPNSACHRPRNTTLQDHPHRLAQRRRISLRNLCPLNISSTNPTRNSSRALLRLRRCMLVR